MNKPLGNAAIAFILMAGTVCTAAQNTSPSNKADPSTSPHAIGVSDLQASADQDRTPRLNVAQRLTILRLIARERVKFPISRDVHLTVGAEIPASVELYTLPPNVVASVPPAEQYKFTVTEDHQIVLVDPGSMRVVDVIRE